MELSSTEVEAMLLVITFIWLFEIKTIYKCVSLWRTLLDSRNFIIYVIKLAKLHDLCYSDSHKKKPVKVLNCTFKSFVIVCKQQYFKSHIEIFVMLQNHASLKGTIRLLCLILFFCLLFLR